MNLLAEFSEKTTQKLLVYPVSISPSRAGHRHVYRVLSLGVCLTAMDTSWKAYVVGAWVGVECGGASTRHLSG